MDYGIETFLRKKQISFKERKRIVKRYCSEHGSVENFNHFANWIDKGIRSGEIKGQPIKLLTESTKEYIESEKERRFYANKISQSIWSLWKISKGNKVKSRQHGSYSNIKQLLLKYFRDNNLPLQLYTSEDSAPKCYELIHWYQYIIDNQLVEHFKTFCKGDQVSLSLKKDEDTMLL